MIYFADKLKMKGPNIFDKNRNGLKPFFPALLICSAAGGFIICSQNRVKLGFRHRK
jgi:hypothetical protein